MAPEDSETGVLAEEATRLRLAVGRLHRRIRIDEDSSLPPLQLSVLATISGQGPMRPSDLARVEAVSAPTMSRVVNTLGELGLVVRTPDPEDARCQVVAITDEGRSRLTAISTHRTALVARRLVRLDDDRRSRIRAALPVLEALLRNGEPATGPIGGGPIGKMEKDRG